MNPTNAMPSPAEESEAVIAQPIAAQSARILPSKDLIYRVAGTDDADWFVKSGLQSVKDIEAALQSVGRTLSDARRVLDFGVGCGRILLPLQDVLPWSAVTGVDIDAEAIAWLRPHVPGATLVVASEVPPLPLPAGTFDLVYCHSVFTHLDANYQDLWLAELMRVTKPGATLVISFSGEKPFGQLQEGWLKGNADPAPLVQKLQEEGMIFIADDQWTNGPFPDFYHSSFHSLEYVKRHWGEFFRILNHLPCGSLGYQDFIVMERTGAPAIVVEPSDTPQEIPLPPPSLRSLFGPPEDEAYDNPSGELLFPEIPPHLYASVFDFGSGCGRDARRLMQQSVRPSRYVGVDLNRAMASWCQKNLSRRDPNFQFLHHNVFHPLLGPHNSANPAAPFPVGPGEFTLVNAQSIFTCLAANQAEFYLREIERILTPDGIARLACFFFDRSGVPWLDPSQTSLFVNSGQTTNTVVFERDWFLMALRAAGLEVRETVFPTALGQQWRLLLSRRTDGAVDNFPSAEESADWLCGPSPKVEALQARVATLDGQAQYLSEENQRLADRVHGLETSWSWQLTRPVRKLAGIISKS